MIRKIYFILILLISQNAWSVCLRDFEMCTVFTGPNCTGQEIYHIYWVGYDEQGRRRECRRLAMDVGLCELRDLLVWQNSHDSDCGYGREGLLNDYPFYRMTGTDGQTLLSMQGFSGGSVCFSPSKSNNDDELVAMLPACPIAPSTSQGTCPNGLTSDGNGGCIPPSFTDDKCFEDPAKFIQSLAGLIGQTEEFDTGNPNANTSALTISNVPGWQDSGGSNYGDSSGGDTEYDNSFIANSRNNTTNRIAGLTNTSGLAGRASAFGQGSGAAGNSLLGRGTGGIGGSASGASSGRGSSGTNALSMGGVSTDGLEGSSPNEAQMSAALIGGDGVGKMGTGSGGGALGKGSTPKGADGSSGMLNNVLSMMGFGGGASGQNGANESGTQAIGFGQSDQYDSNGNKLSTSGEIVKINDPSDYFTRVDLDQNLFKVVETRYRRKQSEWVLKAKNVP